MKIQKKFLLTFVLIQVPAIALSVWLSGSAVRRVLLNQVEEAAFSNAVKVAENIVIGRGFKDESSMLKQLNFAQQLTGAAYVAVTDGRDRFIAHTDVARKGDQRRPDPEAADRRRAGNYELTASDEGPLMEVRSPVWSEPLEGEGEELLLGGEGARQRLGTVIIGIPLSATNETRNRMSRKIAAVVIFSALLFAAVFLEVLRRIIRPIGTMDEQLKNIATGHYGHQIPETGDDEIGGLAKSFNRMSDALARTTISKDYVSAILENMLDPLLVVDADGCVRSANKAALNLLGFSEEELVGRPAQSVFAEAVQWPDAQTAGGASPARRRINVEANLLRKNGETVPVLYSLATLEGNERIIVARDVTERKGLETVIRQSEKMSAVGQLAAGVAHEINNPLAVILGFSQALVRRAAPGDPAGDALRSIEQEAIRCKNLVQDLLTFSRVSNVEREPVDLNRAVESSISLVRTKARVSNVDLMVSLGENLPRVLGNQNQLQQVVINLAANAIDAMQSGGALDVRTTGVCVRGNESVAIIVSDTGPGIPATILNRIFDPFFTTKGVGKGTGLGLSLVHEIVTKHEGTIEVTSRPGRTQFIVTLPASPEKTS